MSSLRTALEQGTRIAPSSWLTARRVLGVALFAVLTALSAKVALPLPGTPVPFTFQPLAVMLAGALLGARLGMASQLLYLAAGMVGLPVFAAGGGAAYLLGPTGGYLLAYPAAAWMVGALSGAGALRTLAAPLAGLAVMYAGGLAWLAALGGLDGAVALGIRPFLLADLVKALLVALTMGCVGRQARDLFAG